MKKGILLIANLQSQSLCKNLVFSIRSAGCKLPIKIIHFGGLQITDAYILKECSLLFFEEFPQAARDFIYSLAEVLTDCPIAYLYRYLGWFMDWDEFLYSDNDIVAMLDWTELFSYLDHYELVHADEEYTTNGIFNFRKPEMVTQLLGDDALIQAITAGHFLVKKSEKQLDDLTSALSWFRNHMDIPQLHDQALIHIAILLGHWNVLNLCKPPHNWLSSWRGDYPNVLNLIQSIQQSSGSRKISHIHFSGGFHKGILPIEELAFSYLDEKKRYKKLVSTGMKELLGIYYFQDQKKRVLRFIKRKFRF